MATTTSECVTAYVRYGSLFPTVYVPTLAILWPSHSISSDSSTICPNLPPSSLLLRITGQALPSRAFLSASETIHEYGRP